MMQWVDSLPWSLVIIAVLFLGAAPFIPQPHLVEKINMLANGTLSQPIDIFDLLYHESPLVLLVLKLTRTAVRTAK